MPLTPFPVEEFGGLNLLADPIEVGMSGAVDLANLDFDRLGRLRTRSGITSFATPAGTTGNAIAGFDQTSGTRQVVVNFGAKIAAYPSAGSTAVATQVTGGAGFSPARFGDTSNEYLYIANGVDRLWRWDGAAFTQPAGIPTSSYAAVSPISNRLVVAGIISTSATMANGIFRGSRVGFSDAGAPETWTYGAGPPETGNFVDLAPGDGSVIHGLATWGNLLFAFKRDRFFVFTGESTKSDGTVQFNYRPVDGFGAIGPPVTGDEGVYFWDGTSIWLTTGGTPTRVSRPIEPFLNRSVTINGVTSALPGAGATLGYSAGRLYMTVFGSGSTSVTLIFDPKVPAWTAYSTPYGPIAGISTMRIPVFELRLPCFIHTANPPVLSYLDPTATADSGTAITWNYQTGYSSAGGYFRQRIISSGERKRHHHVDILGSGTVTHQVLTLNPRTADIADPGGSVTLGTAPALARGYRRRGARGTHIAHKLSGSGPAVISDLTYWLTNVGSDT